MEPPNEAGEPSVGEHAVEVKPTGKQSKKRATAKLSAITQCSVAKPSSSGPPAVEAKEASLAAAQSDAGLIQDNSILKRPGGSDTFLTIAGCKHIGEEECIRIYGCKAAGIVIPFHTVGGEVIVDGGKPFARVRFYDPVGDQKYHQRVGSGVHIYVPHNFRELPRGATLILTEGEFKANALAEAGFAAIGLCGITGATQTKDGEPRLHPELAEVLEFHKPERVLFLGDSDAVLNSQFAREVAKLGKTLLNSKRSAFVKELRVAVCPLGGPKGADDVRGAMGAEFNAWFEVLITSALLVPPKAKPAFIFCALLRREIEPVRKALEGDDHDAHHNRVRLLRSAGRLQREVGAMLLLKPLLSGLLNVTDSKIAAMIRDSGVESQPAPVPIAASDSTPEEDVWPHPVDGSELLEQIAATYKKFCVLPPHAADVLAVWVLLTYCYVNFEFAAVIAVWSPEPECGKGRVLDVTEKLTRNAFRTANTSAPVLYHSVADGEITVLIDEFDSQSDEQRAAVTNVMKSGFQSNGKAHRMAEINGKQEVVEFSTYCPKMVATIGLDTLDKATRTRSIGIRMQRKKREDKISKFRRYDGTEIQQKCMKWVQDNLDELKAIGPMDLDECATDRQEDVWEPLVAIARVAGGDWEKRIRDAARHLSGRANTGGTEAIGHQLLAAMHDDFTANGDKADTKRLVERLNNSGDFSGANRGRGITPQFLAQQLRPYGIEPHNLKMDGKVPKGYDRSDFEEAFQTYLPSPTPESAVSKRYPATEAVNIERNDLFESATEPSGSGSENTVPTNVYGVGSGVADSSPEKAPDTEEEALLL